jgi:hypothetical protein
MSSWLWFLFTSASPGIDQRVFHLPCARLLITFIWKCCYFPALPLLGFTRSTPTEPTRSTPSSRANQFNSSRANTFYSSRANLFYSSRAMAVSSNIPGALSLSLSLSFYLGAIADRSSRAGSCFSNRAVAVYLQPSRSSCLQRSKCCFSPVEQQQISPTESTHPAPREQQEPTLTEQVGSLPKEQTLSPPIRSKAFVLREHLGSAPMGPMQLAPQEQRQPTPTEQKQSTQKEQMQVCSKRSGPFLFQLSIGSPLQQSKCSFLSLGPTVSLFLSLSIHFLSLSLSQFTFYLSLYF